MWNRDNDDLGWGGQLRTGEDFESEDPGFRDIPRWESCTDLKVFPSNEKEIPLKEEVSCAVIRMVNILADKMIDSNTSNEHSNWNPFQCKNMLEEINKTLDKIKDM